MLGLSTVLLTAAFRSVWIPIKAAALNVLTIGESLGAVTLVLQSSGPIEAFVVRCLIVPAVMQLLGPRAWWLGSPGSVPGVKLGLNREHNTVQSGTVSGCPVGMSRA